MILAASAEDMIEDNKGCITDCHTPDSDYNMKHEIKAMAEEGTHSDVSAMVSNDSVDQCLACHSNNLGKLLHTSHLVGTPDDNHFLAEMKDGVAGCMSCHDMDVETGEIAATATK
jgi:cytochrome c553